MLPACSSLGAAHSNQLAEPALLALLGALTQEALAASTSTALLPAMRCQGYLATNRTQQTTLRCRPSDPPCTSLQIWHC